MAIASADFVITVAPAKNIPNVEAVNTFAFSLPIRVKSCTDAPPGRLAALVMRADATTGASVAICNALRVTRDCLDKVLVLRFMKCIRRETIV